MVKGKIVVILYILPELILFTRVLYLWFIFRHVQINNSGAIEFYKKFGFEIHETKKHYYKRIEPADAHVLQKTLRPTLTNGEVNHVSEK